MPIDFNKDGKSLEQQVGSSLIYFRTAVILYFMCPSLKCVHFALYHVIHQRFAFLGNGGETWFSYAVKQFKLLFCKSGICFNQQYWKLRRSILLKRYVTLGQRVLFVMMGFFSCRINDYHICWFSFLIAKLPSCFNVDFVVWTCSQT